MLPLCRCSLAGGTKDRVCGTDFAKGKLWERFELSLWYACFKPYFLKPVSFVFLVLISRQVNKPWTGFCETTFVKLLLKFHPEYSFSYLYGWYLLWREKAVLSVHCHLFLYLILNLFFYKYPFRNTLCLWVFMCLSFTSICFLIQFI